MICALDYSVFGQYGHGSSSFRPTPHSVCLFFWWTELAVLWVSREWNSEMAEGLLIVFKCQLFQFAVQSHPLQELAWNQELGARGLLLRKRKDETGDNLMWTLLEREKHGKLKTFEETSLICADVCLACESEVSRSHGWDERTELKS